MVRTPRFLDEWAAATLRRMEPHVELVAVVVSLVLAGAFTYTGWHFARDSAENEARIQFEARTRQAREAIVGRMMDYEHVLRGAVGLFASSESVTRAEWRVYFEHLRLQEIYPGIQGLGYVLHLPPERKAQHERSVREEGYSNYAIRPAGERLEYAPIIYLEPFADRNLRAFGFDMLSEPVRRATIERARDSGEPAMSGSVTLVQDEDDRVRAGFLMFVPVYLQGRELGTLNDRRRAIAGYIYSPFRMDDLMRGIFGNLTDVRLRIVDDGPGEDDKLLFDNGPDTAALRAPALFSMTTSVPMRGRTWRLELTSLPAFEATINRVRPRMIAIGSGVISVLILAIIWQLGTLRARAVQLARSMTRELRESRERLELAIDGSNQALFVWDVSTGKVTLDGHWARIIGGKPGERMVTIGELEALAHPDDLQRVRDQTADLLGGRIAFYHVEHRIRAESGAWRWISSRAKVVERDPLGRAARVAGTNVDITERKEVERFKNEFIATVSHELRTPLTAIVGALGLLKEMVAGKLPADAATFLGMAEQNSERLAALINDILDIEKIESGRMEFRFEPVAIPGLLERAVTLNAPYAEKYNVRFELARPLAEATVSGDADRLLQVLTNLMSNAAKFSPAGAAVTVSATIRDGRVRVAVSDHGSGVPEEFRGRIFSKFAQADSSDTRGKGGTGLGLAISKAIIENLGGTLGYESVFGRGATFYFDLLLKS